MDHWFCKTTISRDVRMVRQWSPGFSQNDFPDSLLMPTSFSQLEKPLWKNWSAIGPLVLLTSHKLEDGPPMVCWFQSEWFSWWSANGPLVSGNRKNLFEISGLPLDHWFCWASISKKCEDGPIMVRWFQSEWFPRWSADFRWFQATGKTPLK